MEAQTAPSSSLGPHPKSVEDHLLLVDLLARDSGHLIRDDECMGEALAPLATHFSLLTSRFSAARLETRTNWRKYAFPDLGLLTQNLHLQYLIQALLVRTRGAKNVVFQSFDELAVIIFKMIHPSTRVHLIVTSNLTPERFQRSPVLVRIFLGIALRLSASILVHCKFEKEFITEKFPTIDPSKIIIKPNHIMSFPRNHPPLEERENIVAFMGPALTYKTIDPMVKLITADTKCKYRYHFYLMKPDDFQPGLGEYLASKPNVAISYGYLDDPDYYSVYEKASWVILTHDRNFEGRTSGILSDAIASGAPVLTQPIAPQIEYFSQFGPLGLLADFSNDKWIQRFLEFDLQQNYPAFENAMIKARASGGISNITSAFYQAIIHGKS